jgi:hypothetical protein
MAALNTCPSCGGPVRPGARRCRRCDEDLVGDDDGPVWDAAGWLRRDCEPHRGGWVAFLGNASAVLAALALPSCGVTAVLALPLGIAAWVMANDDLPKLRSGRMDPAGEPATDAGRSAAMTGTLISGVVGAGFLVYWLLAAIPPRY